MDFDILNRLKPSFTGFNSVGSGANIVDQDVRCSYMDSVNGNNYRTTNWSTDLRQELERHGTDSSGTRLGPNEQNSLKPFLHLQQPLISTRHLNEGGLQNLLNALKKEHRATSEALEETQQELTRQQILRLESTTELEDLVFSLRQANTKLRAQLFHERTKMICQRDNTEIQSELLEPLCGDREQLFPYTNRLVNRKRKWSSSHNIGERSGKRRRHN
jgi:hypothetical protein